MATLAQEDESALIVAAVAKALFTATEGDEALHTARASGRPVSDVLVERGLLAPRTIESLRAEVASGARTVQTPLPPAGAGGRLAVPGRLGDYEVLQKLGEGGMGAVYRARQINLDREVALKVVSPQVAADPEYAERFLREARAAAKVNHPNVITIFDAGSVDGQLIMALELMRGGDAAQLAKKAGGRLSEARALQVVRDCARGLQALEKAGLVHRDIKPANVFIGADGGAKLADLGLARSRAGDDRMTNSGVVVGTPAFMAPEQADGSPEIDVRADVYALGATLYQLVTGEPPYTGNSPLVVVSKVLTAPVPDPRVLRPDLSEATAGLIRRALAKDRAERFQTATELVVALERARTALGGRASDRQRPQPSGRVIAPPRASARLERPGTIATAAPAPRAGPGPLVAVGIGAVLVVFGVTAASLLRRDAPAVPTPPARRVASLPTGARPDASATSPRPEAPAPSVANPARTVASSVFKAGSDAGPSSLPRAATVGPVSPEQILTLASRREAGSPRVMDLGDGVVHVSGHEDWGRVSFVEGPFELPATVGFECSGVRVHHREQAEQPLREQGLARWAGFFYELGVRLDRDGADHDAMHSNAGADLTDALWMTLTFGQDHNGPELFGLLRAVGAGHERGGSLRLSPPAPGLVAPRARDHDMGDPKPCFRLGIAEGQSFHVTLRLASDGVSCRLEHLGPWTREGKTCGRTFEASWSDLNLTPPGRVWVWAQAGNWSRGRGEGKLRAWVQQ